MNVQKYERGDGMEDIELVFEKYYKYVKRYALSLCYVEAFWGSFNF